MAERLLVVCLAVFASVQLLAWAWEMLQPLLIPLTLVALVVVVLCQLVRLRGNGW